MRLRLQIWHSKIWDTSNWVVDLIYAAVSRPPVSPDPPKPQTAQTVCSANPSIAPTLETLDDAHLGSGGAALIKDLSVTVSDHRGWSETQYKKETKSVSDVSAPYPSPSSGQLRLTHQSVCALNGNWLSEGWLSVASIYWSSLGQPLVAARRDAKYFIADSLILVSRLFVAFRTTVSWPYAIDWSQSNVDFWRRFTESGSGEDYVYTCPSNQHRFVKS